MATKKTTEPTSDGATTNIDVAMQQHGFSGETKEIKLFKAESGEPTQVFVGLNGYTALLHREKWIRVPVEVVWHLESLTYSILESDPTDPDNRSKDTWQEKQRFPMQIKD